MNKSIIGLIIAGILLISIPIGVKLVQQQQTIKSKAAECDDVYYIDGGSGECIHKYPQEGITDCDNSDPSYFNFDVIGSDSALYQYCPGGAAPAPGGEVCPDNIIQRAREGLGGSWANASCQQLKDKIRGDTSVFVGNDPVRSTFSQCSCPAVGSAPPPAGGAPPASCINGNPGTVTTTQANCVIGMNVLNLEVYRKGNWCITTSNYPAIVNNWYNSLAPQSDKNKVATCFGGQGVSASCPLDNNLSISPNPAKIGDLMTFQYASGEDTFVGGDTWSAGVTDCKQEIAARKYVCTAQSSTNGATWNHYWKDKASCGSASYTITGGSGSPQSAACPDKYKSTQVRFKFGTDSEWRLIQSIAVGQQVLVGAFHNETEEASDVTIKVNRPEGTLPVFVSNKSTFTPDRVGTYTFTAITKNTDNVDYSGSACTNSVNLTVTAQVTPSPTPTPKTDISCPADITSTEARISLSGRDGWSKGGSVELGATVFVAGFHDDRTVSIAENIDLQATGPEGTTNSETIDLDNRNSGKLAAFKPKLPGNYRITAKQHDKSGAKCKGESVLEVKAPAVTTTRFRVAENPSSFNNLDWGWQVYTGHGMSAGLLFTDINPGAKFVFVQFEDSTGKRGGCGQDKKEPCKMPVKILGGTAISNCSLSFEGSSTVIDLFGSNFGASSGRVDGATLSTSGSTPLSIKQWSNDKVIAHWPSAPQGKNLVVTLTNSEGQQSSAVCSAVSQLALGVKVFCQAVSSHVTPDVALTLQDATTGEILTKQKVTIDAEGVVNGLNQKLVVGKTYILSVKAPKSLRRNRQFTAVRDGGTINVDFALPLGDIANQGDDKIASSDFAQMVRDWNIDSDSCTRKGDLDLNCRVNSRDWACLRHDFNQVSDPDLTPGVPLLSPAPTLAAGVTPVQQGVCTLGLNVKFEGLNNSNPPANVSLTLFPAGSEPAWNTLCRSENGCSRFFRVPVSAAAVNNFNQDVFLVTAPTNQLSCGASFNVVVGSDTHKQSLFRGVTVQNNPASFSTFTFSNEIICSQANAGCINNCLSGSPGCGTR